MASIGPIVLDHQAHLRLVIVDDEDRVLAALEREIRAKYGADAFSILALNDPRAYLEAKPDDCDDFLVISDLRMPAMNGAEFLERVRAADRDVRTVLLTAYSDMDDIGRAVSSDISGLIAKPWDRQALYKHIDRALADFRLRKDNARLRDELAMQLSTAGEFQKAILSGGLLPEVSVAYRPFEPFGCGGDYYDAFPLPDGRKALIVGDVSGHGIKPALVTLLLKSAIQRCRCLRLGDLESPASLLSSLNDELCGMLDPSQAVLVAMAIAIVDPEKRAVEVSNAGLPSAALCSGGSVKELFSMDGPALGFESGWRYQERRAQYSEGDSLFIYTDGLVEEPSTGEPTDPGEAAALAALIAADGGGADAIVEAFQARRAGAAFDDDVTAMVARL